MRATRFILPVAAFTTLVSGWSSAGQVSCPEVLKRVEETYRSLQSYQVAAVRTVGLSAAGLGDFRETQVSLVVDKPGKVRVVAKSQTTDIVVVSNGETTWTYIPGRKEYTQEAVAASVGEEEEGGTGDESEVDVLTEMHKLLVGRYLRISRLSAAATLARDDRIKVAGNKIGCYVVRIQVGEHRHEL